MTCPKSPNERDVELGFDSRSLALESKALISQASSGTCHLRDVKDAAEYEVLAPSKELCM